MTSGRALSCSVIVTLLSLIFSENQSGQANDPVYANWTNRTNIGIDPSRFQPIDLTPVADTKNCTDSSEVQNISGSDIYPTSYNETRRLIQSIPPTICETLSITNTSYSPSLPEFIGGASLYDSIIKWNSYVCGHVGVCDQDLNQHGGPIEHCSKCRCDSNCVSDCCPDVYLTKSAHPPDAELSCVSQGFKNTTSQPPKRYLMVAHCPHKNLNLSKNERIWSSCENPNLSNVTESTPVYSTATALHYQNRFCAECFGVSEYEVWTMDSFCTDYVDYKSMASLEDSQDYVMKQETCGIYAFPPDMQTVEECQSSLVSRCNVTGEWQAGSDIDDFEVGCALFSQPVTVGHVVYRNTVCALCNGLNFTRTKTCLTRPMKRLLVAPFSVLINFRPKQGDPATQTPQLSTAKLVCPDKEIFDRRINSCRKLFCPIGKFVENHTCHNMFDSAKGVGYILNYSLKPKDKQFTVIRGGIDEISRSLRYYLTANMNATFSSSWYNIMIQYLFYQVEPSFGRSTLYIKNLTVQLAFVVHNNVPRFLVERSMADLVNRGYFYPSGRDAASDLFIGAWMTQNEQAYLGPSGKTTTYVNMTNKSYIEVTFTYIKSTHVEVPTIYKENVSAYIRVDELMHCEQIELNASEFRMHDDLLLYVNQSGNEKQLSPGQYRKIGSNVRICVDISLTNMRNVQSTRGHQEAVDATEIIITIVCTSFSLLGLAITLLIYSLVSRLRTLPGQTNMALWFNLFMAQLLYISMAAADVPRDTCRFFAIVIHYFWLSTFAWKLICGFHLYRIFRHPTIAVGEMKSMIRYTLFAQICPVMIIGVHIMVRYFTSGPSEIGYAGRVIGPDRRICFLTDPIDIGLAFALPISVVLLINTFFFGGFINALRKKPDIRKHASKSNVRQGVVFVKVSFLLGFTWTIGFVAVGTNVSVIWYIFTLFNASLGVFVFLSFGLKNLFTSKIMPEFITNERKI